MSAGQSAAWVDYLPGDPLPDGNVRIRQEDEDGPWESRRSLPAGTWCGWESGTIIAYLPEAQSPSAADTSSPNDPPREEQS